MLSVPRFVEDHGISRSLFYRLVAEGRGPKITKVHGRTLISTEAAAEWRARMERETNQASAQPKAMGGHGPQVKRETAASTQEAA
jgi:predicted DNA-binding transcriptional regulator AlpA